MRQNPDLQFIINHAGFPADLSDDAIRTWKEGELSAMLLLSLYSCLSEFWRECMHKLNIRAGCFEQDKIAAGDRERERERERECAKRSVPWP